MSKYPLAADSLDESDLGAAIEVLRSGRYTMGARVRDFEQAFANWVGAKHAVMVNSGSSANLLLVDSLLRRFGQKAPLQPGDEVLVPALAWPTTVWPLIQLGLVPVYADIAIDTLAIDLESAKKALGPKTKAMFLIHVLGQAVDAGAYRRFCDENGLVFMEDCCESFGAFSEGRHVGTFGMGGTFSHFFSHHLTTIEGGTIVTDDAALADDLRSKRAHGWTRDRSDASAIAAAHPEFDPRFLFITPGYNVRPTDLHAAIGLTQLAKADGFLESREKLAADVVGMVKKYCPWIQVFGASRLRAQPSKRRERSHSWMTLPMMVSDSAPVRRNKVQEILEANGVETRPVIAGNLYRHPVPENASIRLGSPLTNADRILDSSLMIGCHPDSNANQRAILDRAFEALSRL